MPTDGPVRGLGIALGGGAARGWAHIGVLKRLMEAGFSPEVVVGTSIGAVAGGCYIARKLAELEAFALGLTRRSVFSFLDFNLSGSGLIAGQRLCDALDHHLLGLSIEEMDNPFIAVATEIGTGNEIWINRGHLVDAMRASYALPGIFKPVQLSGKWLMDGALVNPIPVSVCRALGAHYVIAVNLNDDAMAKGSVIPEHHAEDDGRNPPEINDMSMRGSARRLLHRQFFGTRDSGPGISAVMMDAISITQDRISRSRLAGDPPDLMIAPRLSDIGLFDFHRADDAIAAGELAADQVIENLQEAVPQIAA